MHSERFREFNLFKGTVKSDDPFWQRMIQILVIIAFWITILLILPSRFPVITILGSVLHGFFGKGPP